MMAPLIDRRVEAVAGPPSVVWRFGQPPIEVRPPTPAFTVCYALSTSPGIEEYAFGSSPNHVYAYQHVTYGLRTLFGEGQAVVSNAPLHGGGAVTDHVVSRLWLGDRATAQSKLSVPAVVAYWDRALTATQVAEVARRLAATL